MYKVIIHWSHRSDSFSRAVYNPATGRHSHNTHRTRTNARFDLATAEMVAAQWTPGQICGQLVVGSVTIEPCN